MSLRTTALRRVPLHGVAAGMVALLAACGQDAAAPTPPRPALPTAPAIPAAYRSAAFVMDVSTARRSVRVTQANQSVSQAVSFSVGGADDSRRFSLLGGDVIELTATDYTASTVGQFTPGKIRIRFRLNITNKLNGVQLITPTWPAPPAGEQGVFLFPFEIGVIATSGGVSVGGEGNEVIVGSPRGGVVEPSTDFNGTGAAGSGAPHNFFNDAGCTLTSNDCFRYEAFSPIPSGATSESREVGFDVDPTVGDFRVRLIVAANLQNAQQLRGSVAGTVTSPQRGPIQGAVVTVSGTPTATTATTGADGSYTAADVNVGSRTVSVGNLPAGCTAPAAQSIVVNANQATTANFSVTCTVPAGTIGGTLVSSLGGGLSGVSVVATPAGGAALPAVLTNTSGVFSIANVPVGSTGSGSLALSNLPAGCTNPGPIAYSGLTENGTLALGTTTITCAAPAFAYGVTLSWGPVISGGPTGRQIELTVATDMGGAPGRPDVNGSAADQLAGYQMEIRGLTVGGQNLVFASRSNLQPDLFDLLSQNVANPGIIIFAHTSTTGGLLEGQVQLVRFRYNIPVGASGPLTTNTGRIVYVGNGNVEIDSNNQPAAFAVTNATTTIP